MANGAITFTWGTPVAGREAQALDVLTRSTQYWSQLRQRGRIRAHRVFTITTGDQARLKGLQLVEGDVEELQRIWFEPEYKEILVAAEAVVHSFSVNLAVGGEAEDLEGPVGVYRGALSDQGLLT